MKQYIEKSVITEEIKRLIKSPILYKSEDVETRINILEYLLSSLDTLEVKEVDLDYIEEELNRLIRIHKPNEDFGWGTLYNVATHFFELGLKAQKGR